MESSLPIEPLRSRFLTALLESPVVLSSPTGSGKSTRVPVWCQTVGSVLVIEPRRVACRSLATRVAEMVSCDLGGLVGYRVRHESRVSARTEILFVTPGVALRLMSDDPKLEQFDTVILDEFHERGMETDLLLALLKRSGRKRLVVMSATIAGDIIATHLGGLHLRAEGRAYPVEVTYENAGPRHPTVEGLEQRVLEAVNQLPAAGGHVLVFLPGKAEIRRCAQHLDSKGQAGWSILQLHGGLDLTQQARVFADSGRRKLILTTNVAETSLTVPGVTAVIDSGLARQTKYRDGRGFLTLSPIAMDSADQRAGRAGRVAPGRCIRLWSETARLTERTSPEIHRESLVPLVLTTAAMALRVSDLPFLEPPKMHAIETAERHLVRLGALDDGAGLTEVGSQMFGLPLDAALARLLVGARGSRLLADVIDLISVLMLTRPIFTGARRLDGSTDDLREGGCDIVASIRALRCTDPSAYGVEPGQRREALQNRRRLAGLLHEPAELHRFDEPIDRRGLAFLIMAALPNSAHVARRRKKAVFWANGGTELTLGNRCALATEDPKLPSAHPDAVLVLGVSAIGRRATKGDLVIESAMPIPLGWLGRSGYGDDVVVGAVIEGGVLKAKVERRYAKKLLSSRLESVAGDLARSAFISAVRENRLFAGLASEITKSLSHWDLLLALKPASNCPHTTLEWSGWLDARLKELGFDSGQDLGLVDRADLVPETIPATDRDRLERHFPLRLEFPDAVYDLSYDVKRKVVRLNQVAGRRRGAPPVGWLPRFQGYRLILVDKRGEHTIRR